MRTFGGEPSFEFRLKLALGGGPGVRVASVSFRLRVKMAGSGLLSCSGTSDGAVKNSDEEFNKGLSSPLGDLGDFGCFVVSIGGETNGDELFIGMNQGTRKISLRWSDTWSTVAITVRLNQEGVVFSQHAPALALLVERLPVSEVFIQLAPRLL